MKSKYFLIVAGLMLVLFSYSSAQVPQLINYQGKLTKSTGAPLDTTISMVFSIYADSNGTILKWSETQGAVKIDKGVFNVLLGDVNPIPDTVFDGNIRYLGVTVGGDPEITPRKPMVSVPYAYRAGTVDGGAGGGWVDDGTVVRLADSTDNVGIGTIGPGSKLDVAGTAQLRGAAGGTGLYVNSSGNVGIGTTTPSATLHIFSSAFPSLTLDDAGATVWNFTHDGSNLNINEGGATRIRFSAGGNATFGITGGNVGIGTTTPNEQLELTGNLRLPPSTATVGVIKSGANRFIHNFGTNNFFAGVNAGNFTLSGSNNTGVGINALQALTTGPSNTAMGQDALRSNTTGYWNTAVGHGALNTNNTGYYNTAVGYGVLSYNTTGNSNTAMGLGALSYNTGNYNTAMGLDALWANTTGYYNTAIGCEADVSTGGLTNATAIGANAIVSASNSMVLGGTGANAVKVGIGTTSPQGALDVVSTTGALIVSRMSTAQRDALTAVNGMIIYNTTTNQFNFRENGAWVTK